MVITEVVEKIFEDSLIVMYKRKISIFFGDMSQRTLWRIAGPTPNLDRIGVWRHQWDFWHITEESANIFAVYIARAVSRRITFWQ